MSVKLTHNEVFNSSRNGIRQLVINATVGTATLNALGGDTPVPVPDGIITDVDGFITFYAVVGQDFSVALTGDAKAWISG